MINYFQLDWQEAREIVDHIIEKAAGRKVAICCLDATGRLLAADCINGVGAHYFDFAVAKARTALQEGSDTVNFRFTFHEEAGMWVPSSELWAHWEIMHSAQLSPGFCGWAGGCIVVNPANGFPAGAIGVSGLSELEDHDLASERPSGWTA